MPQAQSKYAIRKVDEMMMKKVFSWSSTLLLSSLLFSSWSARADSTVDIHYKGTLIALPCTIEPGTENPYYDLGVTPTKSLYRFTRTSGFLITFELKDCDTSLGSIVKASFSGPVNSEGLLMFTPNSEAKGAGIGLEYLDGRPIPIDGSTDYAVPLRDGDMTIRLKAYVQGEREALANKKLVSGNFTAVMTYTLSYE
ncbi:MULTISPECIES: fimbrial protein [Providencia]|uniref:Type 1 fimbrial protein n=1 Tax=Providencia manganoxydans TaxID=2923283 RepID=A0ABX7AH95_9GAMM|nr:fimbrial protein [Providencia manganoxydans]MDX4945558.1 fimbrial protein [Providencia manganoxydans]QQO63189.1 type 1 fimbrial protein [Providencia manganoxydans]